MTNSVFYLKFSFGIDKNCSETLSTEHNLEIWHPKYPLTSLKKIVLSFSTQLQQKRIKAMYMYISSNTVYVLHPYAEYPAMQVLWFQF